MAITRATVDRHLAAGTQADNVVDRELRGRGHRRRSGVRGWTVDRRGMAARTYGPRSTPATSWSALQDRHHDAFRLLVLASRTTNIKLIDVADHLARTGQLAGANQ